MKRAGYIDEKKTGTLNGLEIITIQKLKIDSEIYVFVSNMYNTYEIKQNLRLHGVKDEQIIALTDYDVMACENQYFEKRCIGNIDFVKTFVDCGCYDGNDTKRFLNLSKISDKEIYAFEADLDNYNLIMNNIGHIDGVNCIQQAVSNKNGVGKLEGNGDNAHLISDGGGTVGNIGYIFW